MILWGRAAFTDESVVHPDPPELGAAAAASALQDDSGPALSRSALMARIAILDHATLSVTPPFILLRIMILDSGCASHNKSGR